MICLLTNTANPVLIQKIESGWLSWLADKSQKAPNILIFGSKTIHLRWKVLTPMPLPFPHLFFGLHLLWILGSIFNLTNHFLIIYQVLIIFPIVD